MADSASLFRGRMFSCLGRYSRSKMVLTSRESCRSLHVFEVMQFCSLVVLRFQNLHPSRKGVDVRVVQLSDCSATGRNRILAIVQYAGLVLVA